MVQAIIMAAGKSTRTLPLTATRPKPLLKVLDKTLLEWNLDALSGLVDEVLIVVGYMKEKIIEKIGDSYNGISVKYVEQKEQKGTGDAIVSASVHVKDKFLVLAGDDIYSAKDLKEMVKYDYACLASEVDNPQCFGVFEVEDGLIKDVEEKPDKPKSNCVNTSCYMMDKKLVELMKQACITERGEFEITCALKALCNQEKVHAVVVSDYWLPITYPWSYLEANVFMVRRMEESVVKGDIEPGVHVNGVVYVGKGSVVKSGTYIEGPVWIGSNCVVGPNAYLRPDSVLMDGVRTRAEIYDSVIMDKTTAKHDCYIGHSVIGENCNIGYGTVTADYRHDAKNNQTLVNGCKVDSGRRKLGAFIGDDVKTGIGTKIYPGRKIWPGGTTLPGEVVKEDQMN